MPPISKVKVDYEPPPKNLFNFEVNGKDIYNLKKEEVDFDPSKAEPLEVILKVNDKQAIFGSMPWFIEDIDEKIQTSLGINQLTSLDIQFLNCKSWVANEFLDELTCYDLPEQGLDKLILHHFKE